MDFKNIEKTTELFEAFLLLKTKKDVANFCRDLMTKDEIEEFTRRFQMAKMLKKGISQRTIAKDLNVSITTVTRVNKWLQRGMGGYKSVLNKLHHHKSA